MIGTIRKHSKILWLIIITAIIITFVWWGASPGQFSGGAGGEGYFGSIEGKPIRRDAIVNAQREVALRFFLNNGGTWPDGPEARRAGYDVERETYYRLMLTQKMEELEIHVSPESVAQVAGQILRSLNRGNPLPLNVFVDQVLRQRGMGPADFERFVRHEIGLQQLYSLASASGKLVTPQEAREVYERENEERSTQAAFFEVASYLDKVQVTPEAVEAFFTNQMARYRIPERLQVSYVEFPLSNHVAKAESDLAAVTNLTQRIDDTYAQLGTNYFNDAKSPEEAKERIRELMFRDRLLTHARRLANDFASALYTNEPALPAQLTALAPAFGLEVRVSEPFSAEAPPAGLQVDSGFVQAAFRLNAEEPFAGPLVGENAVFVIAEARRLPSEIPPLEQIRERVTGDFRYSEALNQARSAGQAFHVKAHDELAAGKTFAAICTEAKVKTVLPPPLSPATSKLPEIEEFVSLLQFKQTAFTTEIGQLSPLVPTGNGGYVVFVQERLPMDEAKLQQELPEFTERLRQNRQNEAFNAWFRREVERIMRDTPLFRQPPPNLGGTPATES